MANGALQSLKDALSSHVTASPQLSLHDVLRDVGDVLGELAEAGVVSLGKDENLTGPSLEIRVLLLLQSIGWAAARGRRGLEDLLVPPPLGAKTQRPLVIEVKSDRKPHIQRDQLRQLDDWVFDLSQEERARKQGLGGGLSTLALAFHGMAPLPPNFHPSPHKGVLIFNGPVGVPFSQRTQSPLSNDERAFAVKRNFCVLSLARLLEAVASVQGGAVPAVELWEHFQRTEGEFEQ